jgi:hypothetical protein
MTAAEQIPAETGVPPVALALVVLKVLSGEVKAADETLRAAARGTLAPGDKTTARLPDGQWIRGAKVLMTDPDAKIQVTDEKALLAWVKANRPTEWETVEQVRPAWVKSMASDVLGPVCDPGTGETIPGLEVIPGKPYISTSITDEAADALRGAWRSGAISLPDLLALPAQPAPEGPAS